MVDSNLDRDTDNSFWANQQVTGKQQAVWMKWWNSAVTISWEDEWRVPTADFNDYVATFEMKECGPERFPPQAVMAQDVKCVNPCGDNACSEQLMSESTQRVRFTAGVTIDDGASEIPYEKNGRMIQLTLFGYDDFDQQLLAARPRTVAVCPVLNIEWARGRLPAERHDLTTMLRYGDPVCAPRSSDQSGAPLCSGALLSPTTLPISFSRQQSAVANCNVTASSVDLVAATPSDACAANSFVRQYEMSLSQIDSALSDASLRIGSVSTTGLQGMIDSVDVYVFNDIQTAAFECPSGVNARLDSVAPDIAKVVRYHLPLRGSGIRPLATGRLQR